MSTSTTSRGASTGSPATRPNPVYSALIGVAALIVLLQGLWAGLFIHEGKDYQQKWVDVHARMADVAIAICAIATVYAFVKMRERRDLWLGAGVLTVVLLVEAYIGGIVGDHPGATAIHLPLAMALMALVIYLPIKARAGRTV